MNRRIGLFFLCAICLGSPVAALATSTTLELPDGTAYILNLHSFETAAGAQPVQYVAFAPLAEILRRLDPKCRWDWDARTGLLRLEAADQRFSISSARPIVIVNDRLVRTGSPVRVYEGDIWLPLETVRVIAGSLEGVHLVERGGEIATGAIATSAPIVTSPEQALTKGFIGGDTGQLGPPLPSSGSFVAAIPPLDTGPVWRVVFDPVLIETSNGPGRSKIGPALAQIADRCASILRGEGSFSPTLLTEHSGATSPELILARLAAQQRPPDLFIAFRMEISPFCRAPGYAILYADESVDSPDRIERRDFSRQRGRPAPRALSYIAYQSDNRRLAAMIAAALARVPGFHRRLVAPAPVYLLKRCPTRSAMIVFIFPQDSPDIARFGDGGFRETIARALSGALIAFRSERVVLSGGGPSPEPR